MTEEQQGDLWQLEDYDLAHLHVALAQRCSEELAIMRTVLRSIEDGSLTSRAVPRTSSSSGFIRLIFTPGMPDDATMRAAALHGAFVGIVRALFDYVDRLHAVMRWSESPFVLDRELVGIDELFAWMVERLESEAQEVGAKKSWNNDKKILALGIEGDALTICDGLREVRRSIEHHKAVAQIDVSLVIHRTEIHIDGTLVEGPGFEVSEGEHELSVTWIPFTYPYPKGSRIELDEEQVEEVVRTILNRVMPAMRISAITKMLPQAEVERTPEP